jgi:hypothetical protein
MKKTFFYAAGLFGGIAMLPAQDVSVTVYNQNRAVVRDVRKLDIRSGRSAVSFRDVAAQIDPTTVAFRPLKDPDRLEMLEQNFEYDLASPQTILDKYVDREIRVLTEKGETFSGTLLNGSGDIVIEDPATRGVSIVRREAVRNFEFPKLPEGLITRPTLVWLLDNRGAEKQDVEVSYMTGGVNWHAEYVAVTSPDDKSLDLSGWVSVENHSGISYPEARLKLVAGDVQVEEDAPAAFKMARGGEVMAMDAAAPQFEEKSFFEYHLYTLARRTTLRDNQTKQIALFPPAGTKSQKVFVYNGQLDAKKVDVRIEFKNAKSEGLGLPLPKGKVRVYKEDTDGSLEFIGEDAIDHTPVDEKIRLTLGSAFDLAGERAVKESRKTGDRSRQDTVEIRLRNHKKEAVEITVVETLWGDWKIDPSTFPFVKKDARTAEFKVPVAPDGEAVLTYTAKIKW